MGLDMDLQSIQEVRDLIRDAKKAQEVFGTFDQHRVDQIVKAIAEPVRPMRNGWPGWLLKRPDLVSGRTRY